MSDTRTVQVAPAAALSEQIALVEHYRNRNLLLAQASFELRQSTAEQAAEIERLTSRIAELEGETAAAKKKGD